MHFEVDHDFPGSCANVADVLCDPAFQTQLDLPDLSRPEVVASSVDGTTRLLRLRYEYIGQLDPIARRIIGGRKLTWIQELQLDTASYTGTLSFFAEEDAGRLNGAGEVAITAIDGDGESRRHIAGDLHVRVPMVGGTAERTDRARSRPSPRRRSRSTVEGARGARLTSVFQGRLDMVEVLLRAGADPNARDREFDATPSGWARHQGEVGVAEFLESLEELQG